MPWQAGSVGAGPVCQGVHSAMNCWNGEAVSGSGLISGPINTMPGVINVERLKSHPMKMNFGGQVRDMDISKEPTYTAIYRIEGPEVLETSEWGKAVEAGRWPNEVRPYTSNRQFALRKTIN